MKLLIVGGVAGGASAAARARRVSEAAEIVLFERGPDVSFANCGLPYHVGNVIPDRGKLLVTTPDKLRERFRLDVRVQTSVESIDRARKVVRARDLATGREYEESYDKLILSPGAAPIRPAIPGADLPGVLTLRNLGDVDRIKSVVDAGARRAVVVGAGFIGLELVENLVHRAVETTLIESQAQVLPLLDREMVAPLADALRSAGVREVPSATVVAIAQTAGGFSVRLGSGEEIETDLVVLGVGVRPENQLAVDAGLAIAPRGGILVDRYLTTSDPDIFAVGDAVAAPDFFTGEPVQVPLAGPANLQGRIAADNALGRRVPWRGTQGTAILGLFGKTVAVTGATEKALRRAGTPYRKVYVHPAHHAGYYPGAEGMTLKLLFAPEDGRLLGAQGVGGAGVDKRIDVLSVALQARMTVYDLEELELCYAPQYGSAKDPVNMAGFVAAGWLRGDHPQLAVEDVLSQPESERPWLLDVRTSKEYADGHIPGASNIPVDELRARLDEVPRDRSLAVYCQVGQRGYIATRLLRQHGFEAANLSGGYKTYRMFFPAQG
jgi:NADPH-dependent 2,4-dienoyl-CoA reductase/sulfur reductase-like enzyme/rhodanese-related sulfurtransferase